MRAVNIHEAKTHLSRLADQAAKGEPFVIAKAGKPLVEVVPDDSDTRMRDQITALFEGDPEAFWREVDGKHRRPC